MSSECWALKTLCTVGLRQVDAPHRVCLAYVDAAIERFVQGGFGFFWSGANDRPESFWCGRAVGSTRNPTHLFILNKAMLVATQVVMLADTTFGKHVSPSLKCFVVVMVVDDDVSNRVWGAVQEIQSDIDNILIGGGDFETYDQAVKKAGSFGKFIRSLVGLDRAAAKEAFAEFIDDKRYSKNQIEFVTLIIDELTERGVVEITRVYEAPYIALAPEGPETMFVEADLDRILTAIERLTSSASAEQRPCWPVPTVRFISLTVWGYFTNTPGWGISEIGLALTAYVFAVEGSSGFHTLYSEFSHAF